MDDPKRTLTEIQVREAGIEDWRQILGRIKARFRTGDFATGLALVNMVGEVAEAANHHPDVTLTYTTEPHPSPSAAPRLDPMART